VLVDAVVIDPAVGVDIGDTGDVGDDGLGVPVAELGDDNKDDEEDGDELELEASTSNSDTAR
jgi:hypothetical protein